ncbi:uncharacterized protein LOC123532014 [Mercenaria mercenaria]|uniref:uncharacterized protein LOC123532014 n=1 Tax=Mercenaria mercenaria TaxID=6596 RepID=UPI00234F73AE|nr:uncharacterized protein LOC123532014 [Mercenaria mercenaria]
MNDIMMAVAVFLAVCSVSTAVPRFDKVRVHFGNMYADEDVMLDEEEGFSLVTVSKIYGKGTPTINLHDFNSGYTAVKDVADKACFIQKSRHTMQAFKDEVDIARNNNGNYEISQYYNCDSEDEVDKLGLPIYGQRIATFCENYDVKFVQRRNRKLTKRSTYVFNENAFWCVVCVNASC